jgi:ABC-type uncharacterized transport system substrate-binding protein
MKRQYFITGIISLVISITAVTGEAAIPRIAIVSSYHPEFLWTMETNEGVLKALHEAHYLTPSEGETYTQNNYLQTEKIVLRKWWMDSKRKNTLPEIQAEVTRIIAELNQFKPDIVLTGDDNATNYIGNYYIDSATPMVFWGVNGNPMKYGLLSSLDTPGHNITGVYQADYLKESVNFLKNLLPAVKTIAILSDDSVSSRAKVKKLQRLSATGELAIELVTTITTNNEADWKAQALDAAKYADSFFILNHNTIRNEAGDPVNNMELGAWYLRNIQKPEISYEQHFIVEGMFAAVSDSGVKQGYQAMQLALRILAGENPGTMAVTAPQRGDYVVNKERAKMLGIYDTVKNNPQIEAWVDTILALKQYPQ